MLELTVTNVRPFLPGLEAVLDYETVVEVMSNGPVAAVVKRAGRLTARKPRH